MKIIDVFNAKYTHIGTADMKKVYTEGLWHQSAHAWIFNSDGKVLFQKRSANIINFPNRFSVAAGGCVDLGDTAYGTVIRETKEELGIDVNPFNVFSLGYRICRSKNENRIYNVFDNVYIVKDDTPIADLNIQREELGGIYYADIYDAIDFFEKRKRIIKLKGYNASSACESKMEDVLATPDDFVPFNRLYFKYVVWTIYNQLCKEIDYANIPDMFEKFAMQLVV